MPNKTTVEVLFHYSDPIKMTQTSYSSLSKLKCFFSDAIWTTVGCLHLYAYTTTGHAIIFFEESNDRGYLLIPSNAYTPAANRLYYFDNIIQESTSAENDLPTNRPRQGYEVFYSDRPAYLLVVTCRFLLCFTKTKILDRETYHTQTYAKRWSDLYTTNKQTSLEQNLSTV